MYNIKCYLYARWIKNVASYCNCDIALRKNSEIESHRKNVCISLNKIYERELLGSWSSFIFTYTGETISSPLASFLTSGHTFITAYGINALLRSVTSRHTHITFNHICYNEINEISVWSLWAYQFYCMHQIRTDTTSEPKTTWKNKE